MKLNRILVIDDDLHILEALTTLLTRKGFDVSSARDGKEGLHLAAQINPDLVISDIMMPEMDGVEMLQKMKKMDPEMPVILMTGFSSIEGAIKAIRQGADEYLTKPLDHAEVMTVVEKALERVNLARQNQMLKQRLTAHQADRLVGNSPELQEVIKQIEQSAKGNISVLILGESGTGKELIASSIHANSYRASESFVAINCAAIPNDLLESELFGHEKGAFSGAATRKYGLFEMANKGTLFLDEIGEMSQNLQAKLLRAIETQKIRRIGSTKEIVTDFRLLCSTNRNLQKAMEAGEFRSDLYYRISPFIIQIPPLRTRVSDIPDLVNHFMALEGASHLSIDPHYLEALSAYSWPGNVRELKNVVERSVLLSEGSTLSPDTLGAQILNPPQRLSPRDPILTLAELEQQHIARTVNFFDQNKTKAAKALGVSLKTLYNKLNAYAEKG